MRFVMTGALAALLAVGAAVGESGAPMAVEGGVLFTYRAEGAASVHLAGEFNGWDPGALPMSDDDGDGVWEVVTELQAGRSYEYKFVIDGGASWIEDPNNPHTADDGYGGNNTVLSIAADGSVILGYLEEPTPAVFEPIVGELPPLGNPLYVAIVWHQHQPRYLKDIETDEYAEPWVRMHASKDYYDMVAILEDYPDIHFTVNLTPVLLTQLADVVEGYDRGGGTDRYLRVTLRDAATLDLEDQIFLLTHFFSAHWDNMIHVWPRYEELKAKKGGDSRTELEAAAATFSEQDWRDLQAWFNLAWFDPDFQEGDVVLPDGEVATVRHLIEKGRGFTEADKAEIIDTQMAIARNVVAVHRALMERGQLEVTTTPYYHPILPLVYDTDLAREAVPSVTLPGVRFSHPDDARRHVEKAVEYYTDMFGVAPAGLWPGEGAVAQEIVGVVARAGFQWMASDDQVLQYSLGGRTLTPAQKYQMYWVVDGDAKVAMIFRDHRLSDDIGFNFSKMDGVEAANHMMRSLHGIHRRFADEERGYVAPIILDGENAWEWFRRDGKEFFHSWYDQLSTAPWLRVVTVSEYLSEHPPVEQIPDLWAGSWIGHDFATWIGEPEENRAWEYLARVRGDFEVWRMGAHAEEAVVERAREELLAAEGSDWFWWYGADQTSPLEGSFDEIYRGTLANVYAIMGVDAPAFLSESILSAPRGASSGPAGGVMAEAASAGEAELLAGPVRLPSGYLFSFEDPIAMSVHLAGDFNGWSQEAEPMGDPDGDGVWTVVVELAPGRYEYKFVADGGARWFEDPGNPETVPDPYGGVNSVIVVE